MGFTDEISPTTSGKPETSWIGWKRFPDKLEKPPVSPYSDRMKSKNLNWKLRATQIAEDIVFRESIKEETKELQCWLDQMDKDITDTCPVGRKVEECEELRLAGFVVPVEPKQGVVEFSIRGILFRIHQSVPATDAITCTEAIVRVSQEDDDIGTMENPIIEMGIKGMQSEKEVAVTDTGTGTIRFHKHAKGRLWACAIDEVTKSKSGEYRHTTVERIIRHEFGHMLVINPEIRKVRDEIARCLGQIRACPDEKRRAERVRELLLIGEELNPHYCPGKIIDWMENSMDPKRRGTQGRPSLRLQKEDAILADEIFAEAIASLRGERRDFSQDLATPETGLREIVEECREAESVAIRWNEARKAEIIPSENWFPQGRLAQTPPTYGYTSQSKRGKKAELESRQRAHLPELN